MQNKYKWTATDHSYILPAASSVESQ